MISTGVYLSRTEPMEQISQSPLILIEPDVSAGVARLVLMLPAVVRSPAEIPKYDTVADTTPGE